MPVVVYVCAKKPSAAVLAANPEEKEVGKFLFPDSPTAHL